MSSRRLGISSQSRRAAPLAQSIPVITSLTSIPGLAFWYRADLGIVLNVNQVRSWADQSGNGISIRQLTGANEPTYHASGGANGQAYIDFSEVASTETFVFWAAAHTLGNPLSLFCVARKTALTPPTGVGSALDAGNAGILLTSGDNSFPVGVGLGAPTGALGSWNFLGSAFLAQNTDVTYRGLWNPSGTSKLIKNGTQAFSGSLAFQSYTSFTLQVGSSPTVDASGDTSQWTGWIYEVAGWSRDLTATEDLQVSRYANVRYGTPSP